MDQPALTDAQLQKIIAAINNLSDRSPFWKPAIPIFLAALLAFVFALLLDGLKTRRENRKVARERSEKELSLLSGANTAIAFNIEALIHTTMQQIMPHYHQSHAALAMIEQVKADPTKLPLFDKLLHSEFAPMMTRCPVPYFSEIDFFKELSFILSKDPELLKILSWVITYIFDLKLILNERNKLIDRATIDIKEDKNFDMIERDIVTQTHISSIEIVNAHQLFSILLAASKKIETIIVEHYKSVTGAKLKFQAPPALALLLLELDRIVKEFVPDFPPPEPPSGA